MTALDDERKDDGRAGPRLRRDASGLSLVDGTMVLRGDFTQMLRRLHPTSLRRELVVRAAKIHGASATPVAVDATAGLGEDALLLAAAGFSVTLYERNPTIAALLRDALRRAAGTAELAPIIARMRLIEADSISELPQLSVAPDVILLDPMFPARRKDAASKKKLQLLQKCVRPCDDEQALLRAAIAARPRKVIVKRPLRGPYLADVRPSYSLRGKIVRYDCLVSPHVTAS